MDSVLRALIVYVFLLLLFRVAGRRSLSQVTTFDLVLGLIISEAIQQALIDEDSSLTSAFVVVTTLVGANVGISLLKNRSGRLERLIEGEPVVVFANGALRPLPMDKERVDESDILEAGRERVGIRSLDEVDYAVLECDGNITVVPRAGRTKS